MIFVTVGTHEQPFDRLLSCIDELKGTGRIEDEVVIQTGYSTYEPQHCTWSKLLPYQEMVKYVQQARIVVTHGGPSSFIMPLQVGKIPVVVPRQERYGEHVNDHQLEFAREVAARQKNILVVENVDTLGDVLDKYDSVIASMSADHSSNNEAFCKAFSEIVDGLVK